MFKQNAKKQTTLGFAPKVPSAARVSNSRTAAKPTPYSRPSSGYSTSGSVYAHSATATSVATDTKSKYFGVVGSRSSSAAHTSNAQYESKHQNAKSKATSGSGWQRQQTVSRADPFGAKVSTAIARGSYTSTSTSTSTTTTTTTTSSYSYGNQSTHKGSSVSRASANKGIPSFIEPSPKVSLSQKQHEAFNMAVNQRDSLFITGSAGTGKSVLMREIISAFKGPCNLNLDEIQVTASTGIAAFHIGGKTIHSFSGVGYGKGTPNQILAFVRKSKAAIKRWTSVKVLVIDEISMLDAALFDALEFIARSVRKSSEFFGGIQLILTGDFYQLPPVERDGNARFAFESDAWTSGIHNTVVLTHVFRQKDMRFVDMLNEMRLGRLSDHSVAAFKSLARKPSYPDDGIQATELYALRNQVDEANNRRLRELEGRALTFSAHDSYDMKGMLTKPVDEESSKRIDAWSMAPRVLQIKNGAQVMLIKNMPEQDLVNGSRGVVVGFQMLGNREYPVAKFTNGVQLTLAPEVWEIDLGREKFKRVQLPVILAWALSIHKSQGQTIDRLLVDLGKIFEKGQAYVALSRAVSLNALQVINFQPNCVMAHPRVIQYYSDLARKL